MTPEAPSEVALQLLRKRVIVSALDNLVAQMKLVRSGYMYKLLN
jgi:hypothetical protein